MNPTILLNKYKIDWRSKTDTGFVATITHLLKNPHGGQVQTPIGILLGYFETNPNFWTVKILLREDISYDSDNNRIKVIVKSAYKSKMKYYIDSFKLKSRKNLPIDIQLKDETINFLTKQSICCEPLSLTIAIENNSKTILYGEISLDDID